jgi:hypothetical protein
MTAAWGGRAPATWNRRVATVRSFLAFCQRRRWLAEDRTVDLERRPELADHTKPSPGRAPTAVAPRRRRVREKPLWRLLDETAARANEDDGGHQRGSTSQNRSRLPRKIQWQEPGSPRNSTAAGTPPAPGRGAKEVAAMATTKDRLDELTRHERELDDHDVLALEDGGVADAQVPPAAAGNRPAPAVLGTSSLRGRLLEPITGRWAAIGAVAWVVLLGIGIAVEPQPTNPNAVDPWFLNVLGAVLLAAVVAAFAGFWLRERWGLAASLLASGLLVVATVACPVSGHHTQLGAWWVVQLGCGLGLVTTSALGLRRG